jgi:hypothetical protein
MRYFRIGVLFLLVVAGLQAQSYLDLKHQSQNADFSTARFTKPFRMGTSLPSTCSVGEAFFQTGIQAGQNLYLCAATDTWSSQIPSVGVLGIADLRDCRITYGGSSATIATPCAIRVGSVIHTLSGSSTLTLSGASASGTVFVYWDSLGQLTAAESSAATLTCNIGCLTVSASGFPLGATPIATLEFAANAFQSLTDLRVLTNTRSVLCGVGLMCVENPISGELSVETDTTTTLLTKAALQSGQTVRCLSSTVSNAHSCSLTPALNSYSNGMVLEFTASAAAISGPATVNVNSLGIRAIKRADGASDPVLNEVPAGQQVALRYDGAAFRLPAMGTTLVPGAAGKALISDTSTPSGFSWADRSVAGNTASIPVCTAQLDGLLYLATDSLYSVARCNGSLWTYFFDGRAVTPPSGTWSWDNQTQSGSAAVDTSRGFHLLTVPSTHTAGYAIRYQTAPAGSYTRTFALRWNAAWANENTGFAVGFRDTSGKLHGMSVQFNSAVNANFYTLDVRRQSAATGAASFDFSQTPVPNLPSTLYLRLTDDTSSISFAYSADGYHFHTLYSGSRDAYLSAPQQIFFGAASNGAATGAALDVISIQ